MGVNNSIGSDLAMAFDPALLMKSAGYEPDPWQVDLLRSASPRMLLNCCRQSGKSSVSAVLSIHTAVYQPGSLVLLVSPSLRQSSELFKKCLTVFRVFDKNVPTEAETALQLELSNGSRVVSLPGKEGTIRGYSGVRLLVIDEASRVPEGLYRACRPMLAVSKGRLVAPSTPFGTRGWWYDAWMSQDPWEKYEITAEQCPRISPEFLEEERRNLGWYWFEQEYMNKFLDAETAAFRREDIDRMFDREVETWSLLSALE